MDALLNDLRYSLRRLTRAPVFALVAIATLALGIGANSAIFSFINAVLFKPPGGVQDPGQIVVLFTSDFSGPLYGSSSYADFEDFRKQTQIFAGAAGVTISPINVVRARQVERLSAEVVSSDYFRMLGTRPAAGRLLQPADSAERALVLSENVWRARFGAAPDLVGSTVTLNGQSYTVIGIAQKEFTGITAGFRADAWLPMETADAITGGRGARDDRGLFVFARLRPGITTDAAQASMRVLQQQLFQSYPDQWRDVKGRGRNITVLSENDARVPPGARSTFLTLAGVLLAAVAFVLLICCANVANLLLARAAAREREIAIRYSLGARRTVVLRQLLIESMVLALAGGAAGLLIALWTTDVLISWQPGGAGARAPFFDVAPDARVVAFTAVVSILTGLLFGFAPGLQTSRTQLLDMLKGERALTGSAGRSRLRDVLVGGQIAVALVLAVTAGLLARTLRKASQVDAGFNSRGVVVAAVDLFTAGYDEPRAREFYRALEARLAGQPGVEASTLAQRIPLANPGGRRGIRIPDYTPQPGEDMEFPFNIVGADYFKVMEVPVVRGRAFSAADRAAAPLVMIVNETFAKRFWPGQNPIGKQVRTGGDRSYEVIGVARDGKYWTITESPRPYFYIAYEQAFQGMQLHVRARGNETAVKETVRRAIQTLDPLLPILMLDTMEGQMAQAVLPQRIAGVLVGFFALLAILLAAIGVYGVTSVVVAQRVPELGLRVALGASARQIFRLIVGRALLVAGFGIAAGLLLSAFATRGLRSFLYGIGNLDPVSFGAAALILGSTAALAGYLPARRASRVDPLIALKS